MRNIEGVMHRLEIMFTADVPEDEMARAQIIAHPDVVKAKEALGAALAAAGAKLVKFVTRTIKPTERHRHTTVQAARAAAE
jgi:hypothetical protein